jgi:peptidoglycan DL-endopeptidase CwlO
MAQLGKPYQWGATGPDTFDCSGLTLRAWQAAGVNLPRVSRAQYTVGVAVGRLADLRPGDLVFYGDSPATIHHVGLYVGDGRMVEAPYTGASVRIASIGRPDLVGAIRPGT